LSRLGPGERFTSVFYLGTTGALVRDRRIGPVQVLGIQPDKQLPYWGWGEIPGQYRRRWDGEAPTPPDPVLADLPPLRPFWGL
jgi:hypothetical protein